jgi:hypothetical protein
MNKFMRFAGSEMNWLCDAEVRVKTVTKNESLMRKDSDIAARMTWRLSYPPDRFEPKVDYITLPFKRDALTFLRLQVQIPYSHSVSSVSIIHHRNL